MCSYIIIQFVISANTQQALLPVFQPLFPASLVFSMNAPFFIQVDGVNCLQPVGIVEIVAPVVLCNSNC